MAVACQILAITTCSLPYRRLFLLWERSHIARTGVEEVGVELGDRRPTLEDVAQLARVSRSTVSRVVTGSPRVSPHVRARVERAAGDLGYLPHAAARALAGRRDDTVAVVVVAGEREFAEDPYYGRLVSGVVDAAQEAGVRVRIQRTDEAYLADVPALSGSARFAGTVLVNVPHQLAGEVTFRDPRHMVSLGRSADPIAYANPDNVAGARTATTHLLAAGRSRIGMVAGPSDNSCSTGRALGYQSVLTAAGLRPYVVFADFTAPGAAAAAEGLLHARPDLDALFVASDLMAAGVLQTLAARGIRVPDDVAVVGFDDSVPARCTAPALTTVTHPVEQIAAWATLTSVSGAQPGSARIFPTALVVRGSST
ncbi:MAG: LacI family DNA-binding transcriptional regulator [Streptosporangiales bacterium]|nr:LacI family DNA-binding transcriptional regulator [Streptosporangiales bacterium]